MPDFSPSPYNFSNQLRQPTASAELCCMSGDTNSKKETCNTCFVSATLASCKFQIIVQDPVSHIQSTEWNSTTVYKRSDLNIYTSENALT